MQSRTQSLIESISNTALGYVVALVTQYLTFPLFGIEIGHGEHLGLALIFTAVSVGRNYIVRRVFSKCA